MSSLFVSNDLLNAQFSKRSFQARPHRLLKEATAEMWAVLMSLRCLAIAAAVASLVPAGMHVTVGKRLLAAGSTTDSWSGRWQRSLKMAWIQSQTLIPI